MTPEEQEARLNGSHHSDNNSNGNNDDEGATKSKDEGTDAETAAVRPSGAVDNEPTTPGPALAEDINNETEEEEKGGGSERHGPAAAETPVVAIREDDEGPSSRDDDDDDVDCEIGPKAVDQTAELSSFASSSSSGSSAVGRSADERERREDEESQHNCDDGPASETTTPAITVGASAGDSSSSPPIAVHTEPEEEPKAEDERQEEKKKDDENETTAGRTDDASAHAAAHERSAKGLVPLPRPLPQPLKRSFAQPASIKTSEVEGEGEEATLQEGDGEAPVCGKGVGAAAPTLSFSDHGDGPPPPVGPPAVGAVVAADATPPAPDVAVAPPPATTVDADDRPDDPFDAKGTVPALQMPPPSLKRGVTVAHHPTTTAAAAPSSADASGPAPGTVPPPTGAAADVVRSLPINPSGAVFPPTQLARGTSMPVRVNPPHPALAAASSPPRRRYRSEALDELRSNVNDVLAEMKRRSGFFGGTSTMALVREESVSAGSLSRGGVGPTGLSSLSSVPPADLATDGFHALVVELLSLSDALELAAASQGGGGGGSSLSVSTTGLHDSTGLSSVGEGGGGSGVGDVFSPDDSISSFDSPSAVLSSAGGGGGGGGGGGSATAGRTSSPSPTTFGGRRSRLDSSTGWSSGVGGDASASVASSRSSLASGNGGGNGGGENDEALRRRSSRRSVNVPALNAVISHVPAIDLAFCAAKPALLCYRDVERDDMDEDVAVELVRTRTLVDLLTGIVGKVNAQQEWTTNSETAFVTLLALIEGACDQIQCEFEGEDRDLMVTVDGKLRRAWTASGHGNFLSEMQGVGDEWDLFDFREVAFHVLDSTGEVTSKGEVELKFACALIDSYGEEEDGGAASAKARRKAHIPPAVQSMLSKIRETLIPRDREVDAIVDCVVLSDDDQISIEIDVEDDEVVVISSSPEETLTIEETQSTSSADGTSENASLQEERFGLAGTGKTTVAAMLSTHDSVRCYFRGIAWVDMGKYNPSPAWPIEVRSDKGMSYEFYVSCLLSICQQLGIVDGKKPDFDELVLIPGDNHFARRKRELVAMKKAKDSMAKVLAKYHYLLILDDVCQSEDVEWFQFHRAAANNRTAPAREGSSGSLSSFLHKKPSRIVATTRVQDFLPDSASFVIDCPTEEEALSLLMTESGQPSSHVMRFSDEALLIVRACSNHPLAVRGAGRWIRLQNSSLGVIRSIEAVAASIDAIISVREASDKNNGRRITGVLFDILSESMAAAVTDSSADLFKLCYAAFVAVFCQDKALKHHIPFDVAKILWEKLAQKAATFESISSTAKVTNDVTSNAPNDKAINDSSWSDRQKELEKQRLKDMVLRIPEALAALGMVNMSFEDHSDGSVEVRLQLYHSLLQDFANKYLLTSSGGLSSAMLEDHDRQWNHDFVSGYFEKSGASNWDGKTYDCAVNYALKMIIPHMLQAGDMIKDASVLLSDDKFVRGRLNLMGAEIGTKVHVQDCKAFQEMAKKVRDGADTFFVSDTITLAFERVGAIFTDIAGEEHRRDPKLALEAVRAFQELGFSLAEQRRWISAIAQYEKAIQYERAALGVAFNLYIVGVLYLLARNFQRAMEKLEDALALRINLLGEENILVAETLTKMGDVLSAQDKYSGAILHYSDALAVAKLAVESNKLFVSAVLQSKGTAHQCMGELDEALEAYEESLRWREMELGKDDPGTSLTYYSIGTVLNSQSKRSDAIKYFEHALRLRKMRDMTNVFVEADVLSAEGMLCSMKGETDRALECFEKVVKVCEKVGLLKDLRVASIMFEMGTLYSIRKQHEEAVRYFDLALQARKEKLGDDVGVAFTQCKLGDALAAAEDYERALKNLDEALGATEARLGPNHGRVASILHQIGSVHEKRGNLKSAISWFKRELESREALHGKDDDQVAAVNIDLARCHQQLAKYSKAMTHFKEAYRIRRITRDIGHLDIADILYKIADTHEHICEYDAALEALQEAMRLRVSNLGYDSSLATHTMSRIGNIYLIKGDYKAAMKMFNEALGLELSLEKNNSNDVAYNIYGKGCVNYYTVSREEAKKSFDEALHWINMACGENDPTLSKVYHKMGMIAAEKEEASEAIRCFEECIRLRKIQLYKNEEDEADILFEEGMIHMMNHDYKQACECCQKAFLSLKALLGKNHAKVANIQYTMGRIYMMMNKKDHAKAMKYLQECLRTRRELFGAHLDVASVLYDVAGVHLRRNEPEQAINCLEESLQIRRMKLGDSDVVAETLDRSADIRKSLRQYDEARQYLEQALQMKTILHGEDSSGIATTLHEMGKLMSATGEYSQSIMCFNQCLYIRSRRLGPEHPDTAATLYSKGIALNLQGDYNASLECLQQALKIRQKHFGLDHHVVGDTLDSLGVLQAKRGESDVALRHLWDALAIRKASLDQMKIASNLQNIGDVHKIRNEIAQAVECYDECLRVRKEAMGPDHDSVADAWVCLGNVHAGTDAFDEGMMCYEEALRIRTLNNGYHDVSVASVLYKVGMLCFKADNKERGMQYFEEYIRIRGMKSAGNDEEFAGALTLVGDLQFEAGEKGKAYKNWKDALQVYRSIGFDEDDDKVIRVLSKMREGSYRGDKVTSWIGQLSSGLASEL